jgi:NADH-quinone oxidoreductase subunit L
MKAFIVNRVGDAGFLLGIFFCFQVFGSVNFGTIGEFMTKSAGTVNPHLFELIAVLLFVGAMGKSAQIPLYVWLPDAMAGPTPVSALIHAATMVTAGVYLIARMNFLYHVTPEASLFVALIGAATALFAATIAIAQKDIKKVLAYSTVSQLGLMFLALGTGNYFAAVFHLMTHAFFKALMFLGAGSVIHACHHEQDIFHMGGLRKKMPITFWTFTVGWLAISGIPPLAGFFSKDLILYGALFAPKYGTELWLVGSITSILTSFYMTRLYALTFFGEYRGHAHPHENSAVMWIPLAILAVGSATAGFLGLPESMGHNVLGHFLSSVIPEVAEGHTWLSENAAMAIATSGAVVSILLGFFLYAPGPQRTASMGKVFSPIRKVLENKYWIDELYGFVLVKPFEYLSSFFSRIIDVKVIDAAVLFPTRVARAGATFLSLVQVGAAQFYLLVMLLGAVALMWFTLKGTVI